MMSPARLLGKKPWLYQVLREIKPKVQLKEDFFGPTESIFVGRLGYPNVFVGPSVSFGDNAERADMFGMDYRKIVENSAMMLRSKHKNRIFDLQSRMAEDNRLLTLSKKPTDVELNFERKPNFQFEKDAVVSPAGISANLKRLTITENVSISRKVDKIINDELKAQHAIGELYRSGQSVDKITNILSSGALGLDKNRKLVPTRWGITAIDDMIFKGLIDDVKKYYSINDYRVYESEFLHNKFVILLMPGSWEFENFEAWSPNSFWAEYAPARVIEEYEGFKGRTKYADLQGGGYYASRLGVAEGLRSIGKQCRVVVFREIYEGYSIPVGVWQVRENVRNAFKQSPIKFQSKKEALEYVNSRLRMGVEPFKNRSQILKQVRLSDFV